jgi:hypothetical protein
MKSTVQNKSIQELFTNLTVNSSIKSAVSSTYKFLQIKNLGYTIVTQHGGFQGCKLEEL